MSGIALQVAEFTGRYRRDLRRFTFKDRCETPCADDWGHSALAPAIEIVPADQAAKAHGDNWPHDDPRWPKACERCGYEFADSDPWQRNDNRIFRLPDGTEFAFWGAWGSVAPPGTMIRADWYDEFSSHPDKIESWIVALPDGGEWITSQRDAGGGYWTVTGTAPNITASPSIWHNAPKGWHGWIRDGQLVNA